ncbi:hypothetical protein [Jiangella rhizosphaerae]|nr:hypothetical protein [Jiangella rhizosphaerae]
MTEIAYPLRCQHCLANIRELNGFYEDVEGWTRCAKGVNHKPLPTVNAARDAPSEQQD